MIDVSHLCVAEARAEFMLECALRSMVGGNLAAAAARLGRCREQLTALAEAAGGHGYTEGACCRLGDVCGSQVPAHTWFLPEP